MIFTYIYVLYELNDESEKRGMLWVVLQSKGDEQENGVGEIEKEGNSDCIGGNTMSWNLPRLHKCSLFDNIKSIAKYAAVYIILLSHYSELWRKENTIQQTLSSLKEDLAKADQSLRSMAGKVSVQFLLLPFELLSIEKSFRILLSDHYCLIGAANPERKGQCPQSPGDIPGARWSCCGDCQFILWPCH